MGVCLQIESCVDCPFLGKKSFFDDTPVCKKEKQDLDYELAYALPTVRPAGTTKIPVNRIPDWCPLRRKVCRQVKTVIHSGATQQPCPKELLLEDSIIQAIEIEDED